MGNRSLPPMGGWLSITPPSPAYPDAVIPFDLSAHPHGPAHSHAAAHSGAASRALGRCLRLRRGNARTGAAHWSALRRSSSVTAPAERTKPPRRGVVRGGCVALVRAVGSRRVHEGRGGARAVSRHAARAVGSSRRDALGRRAGGKAGRGEAGARSKMAVQESAAQLSMTLKVQEYPTLKVGAGPPPARGERVNALSVPPEQR